MNKVKQIFVDIVIFGGGVAGLWTLNRLRQMGYQAILLEQQALGGGQSINSQGIIHGGVKYSLSDPFKGITRAIREMPVLWDECLKGAGEIDLSQVRVMSDCQYLWSSDNLSTHFKKLLLSRIFNTPAVLLREHQYPLVLRDAQTKLHVFRIQEKVLDTPSLIQCLLLPYKQYVFKIDSDAFKVNYCDDNQIGSIDLFVNDEVIQLKASRYIFTAGEGNEALLRGYVNPPKMQRRPLQMTAARWHKPHPLYGHYLANAQTPLVTITTHKTNRGNCVWYLGGQIAEDGAYLTVSQHLDNVKQTLVKIFPWLDFSDITLTSYPINRAEAYRSLGRRPVSIYVKKQGNCIVGWPTKLTLCPLLAQTIVNELKKDSFKPQATQQVLPDLAQPKIASPIWDSDP